MDFWFILGVILKMAFILGVALLLYAPVFVLFERRQSAMFQDRLGPYMGGVKMPRIVIDNIPNLQYGGYASAAGAGATAVLAIVMVFLGHAADPALWILPISWGTLLLLAFAGAPAQAVGAWILPYLFHHDRLTLFGGLHALFDAVKAFTKEDIVPPNADKLLYAIAPIIAMIPAFALGAVIPFGPDIHLDYLFDTLPTEGVIDGPLAHLQVANLNVGILYIFAIAGTGVISARHRRLLVGQQVLAPRRPPRRQPDGQLRGHARPLAGRLLHAVRHASSRRDDHVAAENSWLPPGVGHLRTSRSRSFCSSSRPSPSTSACPSTRPRARARSSPATSSSTPRASGSCG
jgi:hypothetical protein